MTDNTEEALDRQYQKIFYYKNLYKVSFLLLASRFNNRVNTYCAIANINHNSMKLFETYCFLAKKNPDYSPNLFLKKLQLLFTPMDRYWNSATDHATVEDYLNDSYLPPQLRVSFEHLKQQMSLLDDQVSLLPSFEKVTGDMLRVGTSYLTYLQQNHQLTR